MVLLVLGSSIYFGFN